MNTRRFELFDAASNADKFWEITCDARTLIRRWGRRGTEGQSRTETYSNDSQAAQTAYTLITSKRREGYIEVTEDVAAAKKVIDNTKQTSGKWLILPKRPVTLVDGPADVAPPKKKRAPRKKPESTGLEITDRTIDL